MPEDTDQEPMVEDGKGRKCSECETADNSQPTTESYGKRPSSSVNVLDCPALDLFGERSDHHGEVPSSDLPNISEKD